MTAPLALAAAGVDTATVRRGAEPTGVALIVVDEAGENQIAVCEGANGESLRTARRVAVTYAGEGAKLFEHGEIVAAAPAVKTTVVNSVGAGDAFCAALTIGLASGITPQRALSAACAVGAAAVADPRSQSLLAQLEEYLPAE